MASDCNFRNPALDGARITQNLDQVRAGRPFLPTRERREAADQIAGESFAFRDSLFVGRVIEAELLREEARQIGCRSLLGFSTRPLSTSDWSTE